MTTTNNKNVIVTGAAGALGQAVTQHFSGLGLRVAHIDYSNDLLAQAFPEQTGEHLFMACDLTNRQSTQETLTTVCETLGAIDILVNVAGGFMMGEAVHETSDKTWDFLMDLNARSIVHTASVIVPNMLANQHGKIINIAANAARQGQALMGAYLASKSAVWRLTESMAEELKLKGINVNCVLPGIIDTPRNRADMPDADFSTWVKPEAIAKVIGFLASEEADIIHGAAVPVTGTL